MMALQKEQPQMQLDSLRKYGNTVVSRFLKPVIFLVTTRAKNHFPPLN